DGRGLVRSLGAEFLSRQCVSEPHSKREFRWNDADDDSTADPEDHCWEREPGLGILLNPAHADRPRRRDEPHVLAFAGCLRQLRGVLDRSDDERALVFAGPDWCRGSYQSTTNGRA